MTQAAIDVGNLVKRYGSFQALHGISFSVQPATIVGFVGPNGAGKTTTMRILLDILRPSSGRVHVLGQDPRRGGAALRARLGYLPGELHVDGHTSVASLLAYYARISGGSTTRWRELAERLGLDLGRKIGKLSKGNKQKVGLVQAFAHSPELLILDEPTSGLDPLVQHEFRRMLAEARDAGQTVLLSSHVLSEIESVADRLVVLRQGRIALDAPTEQVRESIASRVRVEFANPVDSAALAGTGLDDVRVAGNVVTGSLQGNPNALIARLATHPLLDVDITRPDLETAVMSLYTEGEAS